jgi:hypothetical protein
VDGLLLITLAIAFLAIPVALVTAIIGVVSRKMRRDKHMPATAWALVGSALPALMLGYGFYRSWPWPWSQPEAMQDMLPAGPLLLVATIPTWLLCLVVSRSILARR